MTQPSRTIFLPPGVTAPPPAHVPGPIGVPFDRQFFEQILPGAIAGFCSQVECKTPVLELFTTDGSSHFVNGISGVSDQWVALQTSSPDHQHVSQVFVAYQTIFRVEVHPETDDHRRHLGFDLSDEPNVAQLPPAPPAPAALPEIVETSAAVAPARAPAKPRKRK